MTPYTIFGRAGCGYCVRAKLRLEQEQIPFRYVDIHEAGISKADLAKTIGKTVETVPQIFHGREYIGGCTDLEAYLDRILAA
ncbi:MAG: GrxA family glutaredoxin [Pseudomonadales bacterium]|nr:GrxA family glutaredoxin [Pseudomonadales bacterium]